MDEKEKKTEYIKGPWGTWTVDVPDPAHEPPKIYRWLRMLEYVGPLEWIQTQVRKRAIKGSMPTQYSRGEFRAEIREAWVGDVPELVGAGYIRPQEEYQNTPVSRGVLQKMARRFAKHLDGIGWRISARDYRAIDKTIFRRIEDDEIQMFMETWLRVELAPKDEEEQKEDPKSPSPADKPIAWENAGTIIAKLDKLGFKFYYATGEGPDRLASMGLVAFHLQKILKEYR